MMTFGVRKGRSRPVAALPPTALAAFLALAQVTAPRQGNLQWHIRDPSRGCCRLLFARRLRVAMAIIPNY